MSDTSSPRKILILGGSYAGLSTAHYLLKHVVPQLPDPELYQVILVSTSSRAFCRPACPRALISDEFFDQGKLFVNTRDVFTRYPSPSFRFVHGTVTSVVHGEQTALVSLSGKGEEKFEYHALVIATGASTPSPALGFNQGDMGNLRESWDAIRKALPHARSIVIAGGGPAGVEVAGELGEHLNGKPAGWFALWKAEKKTPKVPITLVTSASRILPALRPALADKAERWLGEVGVTVVKDARVVQVQPDNAGRDPLAGATTVTLGNGQTLQADLYIPATGTTPNTNFLDPILLVSDGRVETNRSTLRVEKAGERVYAIGDAGSYARPSVHGILQAVPVLCANMKRDLMSAVNGRVDDGGEGDALFSEDTRENQLVPIGTSRGVGAAMGYKLPSFLVWLVKGRDYWLWTTKKVWSGEQWD